MIKTKSYSSDLIGNISLMVINNYHLYEQQVDYRIFNRVDFTM